MNYEGDPGETLTKIPIPKLSPSPFDGVVDPGKRAEIAHKIQQLMTAPGGNTAENNTQARTNSQY